MVRIAFVLSLALVACGGTSITNVYEVVSDAGHPIGASDPITEDAGAPGVADAGSVDAGGGGSPILDSGNDPPSDAASSPDASDASPLDATPPPAPLPCQQLTYETSYQQAQSCGISASPYSWSSVSEGTVLFFICPVTDWGASSPAVANCTPPNNEVTCAFSEASDPEPYTKVFFCPNPSPPENDAGVDSGAPDAAPSTPPCVNGTTEIPTSSGYSIACATSDVCQGFAEVLYCPPDDAGLASSPTAYTPSANWECVFPGIADCWCCNP